MTISTKDKQPNAARSVRFPAGKRPKEAADYIGCSRSYIYRLMETDPDFPRPVRLSGRCVIFLTSQLDDYLSLKQAEEGAL